MDDVLEIALSEKVTALPPRPRKQARNMNQDE